MGEVYPVLMPNMGNDMEEGTILEWLVAEGNEVNVGDLLFEMETDKAAVEIEAEQAGTLRRIQVDQIS